MEKQDPIEQARAFADICKAYGWSYDASSDTVIRIFKKFTPGDLNAFTLCDSQYFSILCKAPMKGGSVWGTDGGGIGGMAAIRDGHFQMQKSGTSAKRFMKALRGL